MTKTKILYVEDEIYLGKIVKESLESRDFEVKMLTNGLNVLPVVETFKPHICVLDVMLPKKDGFTIGQEIRDKEPELPIIFLTAKNQLQDIIKGFNSGGNDYIKKPFSMEELILRIHNILNLAQQSANKNSLRQGAQVKLGAYTFSPNKFELQFNGEVTKLSNRETQLLKILAHLRHDSNLEIVTLKGYGYHFVVE